MLIVGGRKRKKVIKRVKKTIPKIFACPNCGEKSLSVTIDKESGIAVIKCGRCSISDNVKVVSIEDIVDAYGKFIDRYYGGIKVEEKS